LDNIKWAILYDLPQIITAHWIDSRIDRGLFICQEGIDVFQEDSIADIHERIMDTQPAVLLRALETEGPYKPLGKGAYRSTMPMDLEQQMVEHFEKYKSSLYPL